MPEGLLERRHNRSRHLEFLTVASRTENGRKKNPDNADKTYIIMPVRSRSVAEELHAHRGGVH